MKKQNPWVRAVGFGGVSVVLLLLLTALFAKLLEAELLPMALLPVLGYVPVGLAALGGCLLTALTGKKYRLPAAAVTGGVFLLSLCVMNGILSRGEFRNLLPTALTVAAAVLISALIAALVQRKKFYI